MRRLPLYPSKTNVPHDHLRFVQQATHTSRLPTQLIKVTLHARALLLQHFYRLPRLRPILNQCPPIRALLFLWFFLFFISYGDGKRSKEGSDGSALMVAFIRYRGGGRGLEETRTFERGGSTA